MEHYLIGGLEHVLFSIIYGMSSFPLTFIFFRGVGQPPSRLFSVPIFWMGCRVSCVQQRFFMDRLLGFRQTFSKVRNDRDSGNGSIIGSSKQGMLHVYQQTIGKGLNKTWWHAQRLVLLFFAMDVYEQVNTFNPRNTSLFFRFNIASSQQSTNIKNQCISGSFGHLCGWHCSATSQTSGWTVDDTWVEWFNPRCPTEKLSWQ